MDDLTIIKLVTIAYVVVVAILAYKIRSLRYRIDKHEHDSLKRLREVTETAHAYDHELAMMIKTRDDAVFNASTQCQRLLNYLKLEDVTIAEEKVIRKLKRGKK